MASPEVSSPNDFKVLTFTNGTNFAFTPEMGCMFDGRPIFGKSGASGIQPGESIILPFHIGNLLAQNLAKAMLNRQAPSDPAGIPTGVPLWSTERLAELKSTFIVDLYTEEKPIAVSETERLLAKIEEFKTLYPQMADTAPTPPVDAPDQAPATGSVVYQDKAQVIAELTKRGVKFDARKTKAQLEKLLV